MIRFDSTRMVKDLRVALTKALTQLQHEVLADAEGKMLTPEGRADIEAMPVKEIAGIISAIIVEGPWAVMDEFGKGSLMDTQNPFLDEYRNSELWNPARSDLVIRGRPAGSYKNIFGETRVSSGKMAGLDLEHRADATGNIAFMPRPPSHALQTAMRWMASGRFQDVLKATLQSFPWGDYLVVDKGR